MSGLGLGEKVSTSRSITYGVTADDTAFEQAVRAFGMITDADVVACRQHHT